MSTTAKGAPYPDLDGNSANDVPGDIKALADWVDTLPGVTAMTTVARNALAGAQLWEGRVILNTTTGHLERRMGTDWVVLGVTDHGDLAGLGDDDHSQYLTGVRHDARAHSLPGRLSEAELDPRYGALLGRTAYYPTTDVLFSTTSTVPVDVSAENLQVSFTAPASGKVTVTLEALGEVGSTSNVGYAMAWSIRPVIDIIGECPVLSGGSGGSRVRCRTTIDLNGLSPGVAYTYYWQYRNVGGIASTIRAGASPAGAKYGPAIMEVRAA